MHDGLLRGRESRAGAGGFFDQATLAEVADENGGWFGGCGGRGGVAPYQLETVDEAACDLFRVDGADVCGRPFCWEEGTDKSKGGGCI